MSEDLKIIGYQLLTNHEVELHSQEELQALFKGKVVSKAELQCNHQLGLYLESTRRPERKTEQGQIKHKKLVKDLNKMNQINEIDRMLILNNRFENEAELILKVQNSQNLSAKERKHLLQHFQNTK